MSFPSDTTVNLLDVDDDDKPHPTTSQHTHHSTSTTATMAGPSTSTVPIPPSKSSLIDPSVTDPAVKTTNTTTDIVITITDTDANPPTTDLLPGFAPGDPLLQLPSALWRHADATPISSRQAAFFERMERVEEFLAGEERRVIEEMKALKEARGVVRGCLVWGRE